MKRGPGADDPIAVFDSGVGGLSVLRAIRHELPHEDLLYIADSRYAPYGEQPGTFVERRSLTLVEFAVKHDAKAVVVGCNTATAIAVDTLRSRFALPIVAMEPAVKPAAAQTRSGVIGVLATSGTLSSPRFSALLDRHAAAVEVLVQPCPGLVELVEQGQLEGDAARALVASYVRPLVVRGADTLVLGCTHYPFLEPVIRTVAGPTVAIVDPAAAVARELHRRLREGGLLATRTRPGTDRFWTSGIPEATQPVIGKLWHTDVDVQRLPAEFSDER